MKGIDALTHVVADPGVGAVKLIIGFFKLLGVVGGLLTSTALTLLVIPALYSRLVPQAGASPHPAAVQPEDHTIQV